ncbi:MAG: MerR family transcriptional regulator [Acidobacteria bacterium]|nr:MerR family transcriptional regulator [Acidobacteriota bacterium]
MSQSELRIGELAARTGVSIDTVRYYERRRLLPRAARTGGGFRLFTSEAVERIRFIKQAQEIGLSLGEIEQLLATGGGANECRGVRNLLRAKITELDDRIRAMKEFRATLARHLTVCERELKEQGEAAECPVVVDITPLKRSAKPAGKR